MPNKKPYDVCPNCGAYLDHGERCDCDKDYQFVAQEAAKRDMHLERSSYNGRKEPTYYLVDQNGNKVILYPLRICVLKDEFSPCEYVEYDRETWIDGINVLLDKLNTWQLEYVNSLVQDIWTHDKYQNPRPTKPHIYAKELQPERIYRKVDRKGNTTEEKTCRGRTAKEWRKSIIWLLNRIDDPEKLDKLDSFINEVYTDSPNIRYFF